MRICVLKVVTPSDVQKSDGHTCPYCRCDIRGTESILVEPYLPVRDRRAGGKEEEEEDDDDEDDHEDVELVMKQLACMKKVRVCNIGIRNSLLANLKITFFCEDFMKCYAICYLVCLESIQLLLSQGKQELIKCRNCNLNAM